jgi:hypothetical protein
MSISMKNDIFPAGEGISCGGFGVQYTIKQKFFVPPGDKLWVE